MRQREYKWRGGRKQNPQKSMSNSLFTEKHIDPLSSLIILRGLIFLGHRDLDVEAFKGNEELTKKSGLTVLRTRNLYLFPNV